MADHPYGYFTLSISRTLSHTRKNSRSLTSLHLYFGCFLTYLNDLLSFFNSINHYPLSFFPFTISCMLLFILVHPCSLSALSPLSVIISGMVVTGLFIVRGYQFMYGEFDWLIIGFVLAIIAWSAWYKQGVYSTYLSSPLLSPGTTSALLTTKLS